MYEENSDRIRPTIKVTTPAGPIRELDDAAGWQQLLLGGARQDGSPLLVGLTRVLSGRRTELIVHTVDEIAYVLEGSGAMATEEDSYAFAAGDAIVIGAGCWHAIEAGDTDVSMLYIFPQPDVPPTSRWDERK